MPRCGGRATGPTSTCLTRQVLTSGHTCEPSLRRCIRHPVPRASRDAPPRPGNHGSASCHDSSTACSTIFCSGTGQCILFCQAPLTLGGHSARSMGCSALTPDCPAASRGRETASVSGHLLADGPGSLQSTDAVENTIRVGCAGMDEAVVTSWQVPSSVMAGSQSSCPVRFRKLPHASHAF